MKTSLGADQAGELCLAVGKHLCIGETFLVEEVEVEENDRIILTVLGSRGTNLTVELTDNGWTITGGGE